MALSERSLARRAIWLAAAGLGFYVLGLVLVLALLWLPRLELAAGELSVAGVLSAIGAFWVALGFLPRFERKGSEPPLLDPSQQPRLHAFLADVARRVGEPTPNGIHLFLDANALVLSRSRLFRPRRVLVGIGVPLFAFLEREELASVILHELGHRISGDLALGPWVYRARRSIGNALEHLDGSSFFLHLPFVAYGEFFLRSSFEISRAQELQADRVAAGASSVAAAARALEIIHEQGPLWAIYLRQELLPVVGDGFLPPVLEGFRRFEAAVRKTSQAELAQLRSSGEGKSMAYDSHPTLGERLEALGVEACGARSRGHCLDLLDDCEPLIETLIREQWLSPGAKLQHVTWEEVSRVVLIPRYRATLAPFAQRLARLTPSRLPAALAGIEQWAAALHTGPSILSPEAERRRAVSLLGAWLCLFLHEHGFAIETEPGCAVRAERGDDAIEPFSIVLALSEGQLPAAVWSERCQALRLP